MSFHVEIAVCIFLVPILAAALTALVGQRRPPNRFSSFMRTFAVDSGFLGAFLVLPWTKLIPEHRWQWIPYLTATAVSLHAIPWERKIGLRGRRTLWLLFIVGASLLLVPKGTSFFTLPGDEESQATRLYWVSAMGAAIYLLWLSLQQMARKYKPLFTGLTWLVVVISAGVVLFASGNAKFAELAAALSVALATATAVAWWFDDRLIMHSAVPTLAVALPGLVLNGRIHSFSGVPLASYALVLSAPLLVWCTQLRLFRAANFRWTMTFQAAGMFSVLAAAVLWAVLA